MRALKIIKGLKTCIASCVEINYHCIIAHFGRYDHQNLIKGRISNALDDGEDLAY